MRTGRASALDARIALGEEQMPERARLGGSAALLEESARKRERGVERLARGRLHALDDRIHGLDAREFALRRGALARDRRLIGRAAFDRSLAQAPRRRAASRELAGIRERGRLEGGILGDAIDDAELGRPRAPDGIAAQHERERRRRADEPRQALGAARSRQQAEPDLRQAERGLRRGDAVMAGERQLETAAERCAMDRRDDGLGARLDPLEHVVQQRRARLVVEFADVGAGDEMPAHCADEDGAYLGVAIGRDCGLEKRRAHRMRQRIHRGMIDRDQRDIAATLLDDQGTAHGRLKRAAR